MLKIEPTGNYEQMLQSLTEGNEELVEVIQQRAKLFQRNPNDTRLDNHELHGRMEGRFAFTMTEDIRVVYRWIGKTTVRFLAIGTHETVYKKSS